MFNDYRDDERKYHYNNIQTEIYDAFLKRIANEAKFLNQPEKRLTNEFKSYSEFFNAKLRQQENIVKDLKAHQKHIKDNAETYAEQMNLFKNLKQHSLHAAPEAVECRGRDAACKKQVRAKKA